jgi:hypothetical protein
VRQERELKLLRKDQSFEGTVPLREQVYSERSFVNSGALGMKASTHSGLVAGGARRVDVSKEAARQHRRCRWRRRGNASRSGGTG